MLVEESEDVGVVMMWGAGSSLSGDGMAFVSVFDSASIEPSSLSSVVDELKLLSLDCLSDTAKSWWLLLRPDTFATAFVLLMVVRLK